MKRKILIGLIIASVVLVITNPSEKEFQEYIKWQKQPRAVTSARTGYFLVFSIYEYQTFSDEVKRTGKYLGICKNYIEI